MSYSIARKARLPLILIASSLTTVGCTSMQGPMGPPGVSIQGQLPGHLSIQVQPGAFGVPSQGPQYYQDPSQYANPGQQQYYPQQQQYAYSPTGTTAGAPLTGTATAAPTGAIPATGAVASPLAPTGQVIAGAPGSFVNPQATAPGAAPMAPGTTAQTTAADAGMPLDQNWIQYFHDNLNRLNSNDLRPSVQQALTDPYAGQALTPEQRYQVTEQRWQSLENLRQQLYTRASENTAATVAQLKQAAQGFSRNPQTQGQAIAYLTSIDTMTEAQIRGELEQMYNAVVAAQARAASERDAAYQAAMAQQAQSQQLLAQNQGQYQQPSQGFQPGVTAQGAPRLEDPLADVELLGLAAE